MMPMMGPDFAALFINHNPGGRWETFGQKKLNCCLYASSSFREPVTVPLQYISAMTSPPVWSRCESSNSGACDTGIVSYLNQNLCTSFGESQDCFNLRNNDPNAWLLDRSGMWYSRWYTYLDINIMISATVAVYSLYSLTSESHLSVWTRTRGYL